MRRLVLLVALAGLLVLVAPPPSPVHLSYVTSDSMAPTLEAGDAYLVVDSGAPTTGDVLVYDAETREGYTTHRVVDVTDNGYMTQGDANPTPDQASGEPPVTEDQILGTVLSVGDQPLAIPLVGSLAASVGVQDAALFIVGLLGIRAVGQRNAELPDRSAPRVSSVFVPLVVLFVIAAALSLTIAPTTQSMTYTATESGSAAPAVVPVGEPSTVELRVAVRGLPLTHTVFEADGATVTSVESADGGAMLTATLPARAEPGSFDVAVTAVPYPQTLPAATIETLHAVHPLAARLATIGAAVLPLWLLYWLFVDGRSRLRTPANRRLVTWGDRR
jgi:signal peptidase